jgi:hypothetical protein
VKRYEAITEKFGVAEQECSRLSSEKGNFISKVILIIFMTEMFLNAHFRTVYREKKDNTVFLLFVFFVLTSSK